MKSRQPRKQRKMLYQALLHRRYKMFAAPLSPELKAKFGFNAIPVRRGDTVRIMRGDHKGLEGKVINVDRKKFRISIEGVTREKVDGTTIPVLIHPSKVMIINLDRSDKWRREIIERKSAGKKIEVPEETEKAEEEEEKPKPLEIEKKEEPKKTKRKKKSTRALKKRKVEMEEAEEKPKKKKTRRGRAKKTEGGAKLGKEGEK